MTVMKGVSCMKEMDVEQLLSDLHKATGMAVQLSDAQFRSLLCFNSSREYCALLHNEAGALEACMRSESSGSALMVSVIMREMRAFISAAVSLRSSPVRA